MEEVGAGVGLVKVMDVEVAAVAMVAVAAASVEDVATVVAAVKEGALAEPVEVRGKYHRSGTRTFDSASAFCRRSCTFETSRLGISVQMHTRWVRFLCRGGRRGKQQFDIGRSVNSDCCTLPAEAVQAGQPTGLLAEETQDVVLVGLPVAGLPLAGDQPRLQIAVPYFDAQEKISLRLLASVLSASPSSPVPPLLPSTSPVPPPSDPHPTQPPCWRYSNRL